ncbi:leucyl aminopeptidase [Arthrobacter flavus]|uniref:Probable cytosol aminopeptidase n=1 Tax=Arthrobacter flavus TaxID=95172 RepID=A0ABW4Q3R2_9MICC
MTFASRKLISPAFSPTPSLRPGNTAEILVSSDVPAGIEAVGYLVGTTGTVPEELRVDRDALRHAGFEGKVGQTLLLPQPESPALIAVGAGERTPTVSALRDLAATFARAGHRYHRIGLVVGDDVGTDSTLIGQALAEGVLLARYRYTELQTAPKHVPLVSCDFVVAPARIEQVAAGAGVGRILARATNLARDLANTPPGHLTAVDLGEQTLQLGQTHGLEVSLFNKQHLIELGCGGLLGVNAGSAEEPLMIQITYRPPASASAAAPTHLALVGKGIMYDSGGISLKPSDPMHFAMKMDMAGAAAVLGVMTALGELDCRHTVTARLMCTDNMPSGSAMKLGDVLTIRGGTTVEIKNSDAEGRLVMSDALALAAEEGADAIIDIATLTGAALMALGTHTAALFGNNQVLIDQGLAASLATDESVWQLPLEHRYREQLDSHVADMSNMGGKYAGSTTAALFLEEFVDGIPWLHFDIAGTMQAEKDDLWRSQGATGFGTRLLIELIRRFVPVR